MSETQPENSGHPVGRQPAEPPFAVTDPLTGELVRAYPTDTDDVLCLRVTAAHSAFRPWSVRHVESRATLMRRVADLHHERRAELAAIISREMGKSDAEALGEVNFSAAIYHYYADHAAEFLADEKITVLDGPGTAIVRRQPLGVLLGIMPWNYPYYQVARFAGPNLVAGNTVLLKHATQCPESAAAIEQIFQDADFPAGAYQNIYADNSQIENLIADRRVQGVSLTGSERAGAAVAEIAGRHLKKVVLELGGSDPFILLSTDDLDQTVASAVAGRLENAGQACNAAKRMIVHEDLYDEFIGKFTDKILASTPAPLSSMAAAERLEQQVAGAVADGATFLAAGRRAGAHHPPGVLTGVRSDSATYREELFGPIAMVFKIRSEEEAVEIANDTPYGLGSYVFTVDADQAVRVADQLDVGMVFINGVGAEGPELPFGGVKRSGFGRELGRHGMDEFINKKLIRTVS